MIKGFVNKVAPVIVSVFSGWLVYLSLSVAKSLCYYAGDGYDNYAELRHACYERFIYSDLGMFLIAGAATFAVLMGCIFLFRRFATANPTRSS